MKPTGRTLFSVLCCLLVCSVLRADVTVAAAANLTYVMEPLKEAFQKQHPKVKVDVVLGASGTLFAQISHGAPLDAFLSADADFPRRLITNGLAEKGSYVVFARGRVALWSVRLPVQGELDAILHDPRFHRLALANPATAPYGEAAKEVLQHAGMWDASSIQKVMGENIAQTAQFVDSGNADAGFVALSFLRSPKLAKKGQYLVIPENLHSPLEHAAVLTSRGAANADARDFLAFLQTDEAKSVLESYGYGVTR